MNATDQDIDRLLDRLDAECRKTPYPPLGLGIHGNAPQRDMMRLLVVEWLASVTPESSR